jgi:hypothetical protein
VDPVQDSTSSVPFHNAMQNEGPAHDNEGGPVAPVAPAVSVALHLPDW